MAYCFLGVSRMATLGAVRSKILMEFCLSTAEACCDRAKDIVDDIRSEGRHVVHRDR